MHNFYYYILFFSMIISVYSQSTIANKIDATLTLINEDLIAESIDKITLLDHKEDQKYAVNIDKDLLDYKLHRLIDSNLYFAKCDITYFFYDVRNQQSCAIGGNYCNSVQFKVELTYKECKAFREYRYELIC